MEREILQKLSFDLVTRLSDQMLILLDSEGHIQSWNPGAQLLFGYSPEEILGKHFRLLFTDEQNREGIPERELGQAAEAGVAEDRRWHERKDGSQFFADGMTTSLRHDDGSLLGFAKIARDATRLHSAESQLGQIQQMVEAAHQADSEQSLFNNLLKRLCTVFQCDLAAVLLHDPEKEVLRVTAAVGIEEGVEIPVGEGFAGKVWAEQKTLIWNDPDPEAFRSAVLQEARPTAIMGTQLKTGSELLGVLHVVATRGGRFAAQDMQVLQLAADRIAVAVLNNRLFQSERRARQQAAFLAEAGTILSSSLDYERTLRELARIAVPRIADWCAIDIADGEDTLQRLEVAHVDPDKVQLAYELQRDYPARREAEGGAYGVYRSGQPIRVDPISDEILRSLAQDEEHFRRVRELGLRSYLAVPLCSRSATFGVLTLAFGESERHYREDDLEFARDLASRAALAIDNARLFGEERRAREARDVFMATLSHEMRTPMTSILGWVSMLESGRLSQEDQTTALSSIRQSAEVQARLIEDLLDVSRVIAGKLTLQMEEVHISDLIADTVTSLRPAATAAGVHLVAETPPGEPLSMKGDRARLKQILWNLMNNAIKFSRAGGLVRIRAEQRGDELVVTVTDTGRGISKLLLPHLFEPFHQVEGVDDMRMGGLGLGLSIVRHLAEMHGGRASAESQGEGRGATFTLVFPLSTPDRRGAD